MEQGTETTAIEVRTGEVDLAIEIMREVAQWCIDVGRPMWALAELTREKLLRAPRDPESFVVAQAGGEPAASMILQWHDPVFWPSVRENECGFVHKLCVRRSFAGRAMSRKMMDYAIQECRRRGIRYVRLDTDPTKPRLCRLYESMGFVGAGGKTVEGRAYALYELKIGE